MISHRIALDPGDGIGPDVVDQAVRVLQHVQQVCSGFELQFTRFDWGVEHHAAHGRVVPEDYLGVLRPFDAIFAGVRSALAHPGEIDFVVVRENSEGEYFSCGGRFKPAHDQEVAIQTAVHTQRTEVNE